MAAERGVLPAVAASGAARTVTLYCRCTLHVRPDGSGSGVITDPRCEIHGREPALIVKALRAGMSWAEAAEKFGTMANPNDTTRTLPNGRVIDLTKMTTADIAEAHNAGVLDLGLGTARVVGESAITFDLSSTAAKGTMTATDKPEPKCDGNGYDPTEGTNYEQRGEWVECPGCSACKPGDGR